MIALLAGCAHERRAQVPVPPAPSIPASSNSNSEDNGSAASSGVEPSVPANAQSLYTQIGIASWYRPHYNKPKRANCVPYDIHQLTSPPPPLPLHSLTPHPA